MIFINHINRIACSRVGSRLSGRHQLYNISQEFIDVRGYYQLQCKAELKAYLKPFNVNSHFLLEVFFFLDAIDKKKSNQPFVSVLFSVIFLGSYLLKSLWWSLISISFANYSGRCTYLLQESFTEPFQSLLGFIGFSSA